MTNLDLQDDFKPGKRTYIDCGHKIKEKTTKITNEKGESLWNVQRKEFQKRQRLIYERKPSVYTTELYDNNGKLLESLKEYDHDRDEHADQKFTVSNKYFNGKLVQSVKTNDYENDGKINSKFTEIYDKDGNLSFRIAEYNGNENSIFAETVTDSFLKDGKLLERVTEIDLDYDGQVDVKETIYNTYKDEKLVQSIEEHDEDNDGKADFKDTELYENEKLKQNIIENYEKGLLKNKITYDFVSDSDNRVENKTVETYNNGVIKERHTKTFDSDGDVSYWNESPYTKRGDKVSDIQEIFNNGVLEYKYVEIFKDGKAVNEYYEGDKLVNRSVSYEYYSSDKIIQDLDHDGNGTIDERRISTTQDFEDGSSKKHVDIDYGADGIIDTWEKFEYDPPVMEGNIWTLHVKVNENGEYETYWE